MNHSFDVDVASEYGVNAAIIFNNISFLCKHNEANGINFRDGKYWTYNSRKAYCTVYPYLTEKQIRTALERLVEGGMLETGNFNEFAYDRTLWYTVTEKGKCLCPVGPDHLPCGANANDREGQPIPDINTVEKPDKKQIYIASFNEFYSLYPNKKAKEKALKAWLALKPDRALVDTIVADVKARCDGEWRGKDKQYIPYPATYLNGKRWQDEQPDDTPGLTEHAPDFMVHRGDHKYIDGEERKAMYKEMGLKVT